MPNNTRGRWTRSNVERKSITQGSEYVESAKSIRREQYGERVAAQDVGISPMAIAREIRAKSICIYVSNPTFPYNTLGKRVIFGAVVGEVVEIRDEGKTFVVECIIKLEGTRKIFSKKCFSSEEVRNEFLI